MRGIGKTVTARTVCISRIQRHFCASVGTFWFSVSHYLRRLLQYLIMTRTVILWAQFAYAIWQFVRVAKVCRIPYGVLNSLFACLYFFFKNKSKIVLPFQKVKYTFVHDPGVPYYMSSGSFERYGTTADIEQPRCNGENLKFKYSTVEDSAPQVVGRYYRERLAISKCKLRLNGEDYSFLLKSKSDSFLFNICRDEPNLFCMKSDMLIPGLSIVEPIDQVDALNKIICEGYIPAVLKTERVLPIWLAEEELNKNFIRILSTIPLVAQAKGQRQLSYFIFFAVVAVDQMGVLFEIVLRGIKDVMFHVFKKFISERISSPRARISLCEFFSSFDGGLNFCDQYCHNFVRIKKGQDFLVCNSRAYQLEGEMGEYISHYNPNGEEVEDVRFREVSGLKLQTGEMRNFNSRNWLQYSIGKTRLFIHRRVDRGQRSVCVFCSDICVHSGVIDDDCKFYMLNSLKIVATIGHLPIRFVRGNQAHCVNMNDFVSDPLCYLSIQLFKADKNIWVGH